MSVVTRQPEMVAPVPSTRVRGCFTGVCPATRATGLSWTAVRGLSAGVMGVPRIHRWTS
jgi:hypothetical protein